MRSPVVTPRRYRQVTAAALAMLVVIVVSGAAVRLTGSGLGCPTWPNCEPGRLTPKDATSIHALVEFGNRLFTGAVSVSVALAVLGSLFRAPRRTALTRWSLSLVLGVLAQIVLGGLTVLFELAPPFVIGHFLLSAVLVGCATVLHHRAGEPDRGMRRPVATPEIRSLTIALVVLSATVLVTGTVVTGSGPHGGDEDVERLAFALRDVARIHSVVVWVLLLVTLWTWRLIRRGGASPAVDRAVRGLIVASVAQGFVGYVQYFGGVPETLVALHIFGSMVVWILALVAFLSTTTVEADERPTAPNAERTPTPDAVGSP